MENACASPDWVSGAKLKRSASAGNFAGAWSSGQLKKPRIVYNSKRHRDPFNLSADDEKENEVEVRKGDAEDVSAAAANVDVADAETIAVAAPTEPKAQKQRKKQKQKQKQETRTTSTKWYEVEKVIRQKQSKAKEIGKSESQYLVKWAGKQASGRPWPCSWEQASHISSDVLRDWQVEMQRRKSKPDDCESGKPVKPGAQIIGECQYDPGKVSIRLVGGREMMVNWENVRFGNLMTWDAIE